MRFPRSAPLILSYPTSSLNEGKKEEEGGKKKGEEKKERGRKRWRGRRSINVRTRRSHQHVLILLISIPEREERKGEEGKEISRTRSANRTSARPFPGRELVWSSSASGGKKREGGRK